VAFGVRHKRIKAWVLEQAGLTFDSASEPHKLGSVLSLVVHKSPCLKFKPTEAQTDKTPALNGLQRWWTGRPEPACWYASSAWLLATSGTA